MGKGNNPLKCVLDLRNIPPSAFALPGDGRKEKHLCRLRKELVWFLSTYANPDGTSIRPSRGTMAASLGVHIRTISRLLVDVKTLGYLTDEGWHVIGETRVRNRALHVAKIQQAAGVPTVPDTRPPAASSVPDTPSAVPDTQGHSAILAEPLCQIGASTVPNSYGTEPPLIHRPSEPPTQPPTVPPAPKKLGAVGEGVCVYSFEAHLAKEAAYPDTWETVQQHVHLDMLTSSWKRDEMQLAEKLIAAHGWETFVAVEKMYWLEQDPQSFSKTMYKWSGMLVAFTGLKNKLPKGVLRTQAEYRWKETPEGAKEYQRQLDAQLKQAAEAEQRERDARDKAQQAKRTPFDIENDRRSAVRDAEIQRFLQGESVIADQSCWESVDFEGVLMSVSFKDLRTREEISIAVDEETGKLVGTIAGQQTPSILRKP